MYILQKQESTLYNTALRQGLGRAMQLLAGTANEAVRVRTLYRCRVNGHLVRTEGESILINGRAFLPNELDNPKKVLETLKNV